MSVSSSLKPVAQAERIHILDVLRGFAIFGILVVNIVGFDSPSSYPDYVPPQGTPWYDELAELLLHFFMVGKFYAIFSFLFGLGFSVQLTRSQEKEKDIHSFYPRRLWVLFAFGLLHAILFWTGDILRHYALLGFILLGFRKYSNRTLLLLAGIFAFLSLLLDGLVGGPEGGERLFVPIVDSETMARNIYNYGSFFDVVKHQILISFSSFVVITQLQGFGIMVYFLLGLLAGRIKFFERLPENRVTLQRIAVCGGLVGVVANGAFVFGENLWLSSLSFVIGGPLLAACYISIISLLSLTKVGARLLVPIGKVGRMALSNYVLQSILCAILFNGYGFGLLGGRIGMAGLWGISLAVYLMQIPLSVWWLGRFQFGPLEWLWRSLTYGQKQPFLA
jgi:uncharacterized protein